MIEAALQRGLILLKAGISGNCIRVLCPLTIEDAVLDEALAVWEDALGLLVPSDAWRLEVQLLPLRVALEGELDSRSSSSA